KAAACFFEIGLSGVLTFSAIWAMILDLLSGVAIEFSFLLRCNCLSAPDSRRPRGTIAVLPCERKHKRQKKPAKQGFSRSPADRFETLKCRELLVKESHGLDAAKIIFQRDVLVRRVRVLVRQAEAQQHAGNLECVVHLRDEGNRAALANEHRLLPKASLERVNCFLENRVRVGSDPRLASAQ